MRTRKVAQLSRAALEGQEPLALQRNLTGIVEVPLAWKRGKARIDLGVVKPMNWVRDGDVGL